MLFKFEILQVLVFKTRYRFDKKLIVDVKYILWKMNYF